MKSLPEQLADRPLQSLIAAIHLQLQSLGEVIAKANDSWMLISKEMTQMMWHSDPIWMSGLDDITWHDRSHVALARQEFFLLWWSLMRWWWCDDIGHNPSMSACHSSITVRFCFWFDSPIHPYTNERFLAGASRDTLGPFATYVGGLKCIKTTEQPTEASWLWLWESGPVTCDSHLWFVAHHIHHQIQRFGTLTLFWPLRRNSERKNKEH